MGLAAVRGAPRSVRGGRSTRYEERRLRRGSVRAWAPSWSDATAEAVLKVLEDACERATGSKVLQKKKVAGLLKSTDGVRVACVFHALHSLARRRRVGSGESGHGGRNRLGRVVDGAPADAPGLLRILLRR